MHRHLLLLVLVALIGSGVSSSAQQGAACASPEYRQFDFWVGDWEVFAFTGGNKGALAGTNRVVKLFDGCVIQENWQGSQGGNGSSFNTYQSAEKKWHQVWVDNGGSLVFLKGEFKDGKMVLEGTAPGQRAGVVVNSRVTWSLVNSNPDQVRQLGEESRDGGNTWRITFDLLYVRKK